ncbi:MAG: hypothetical protein Q4F76_06040 [Lachnospiraceae bacterium]|nr:hypothetical protein [Lachnospiraceae bacterium]
MKNGKNWGIKAKAAKKITAAALAALLTLGGSLTAYGAGWQQDTTGWWYEREDGTYPVSTWYEDTDGSWYFFNEQGYMVSNCYQLIDGNFYAFGSDGRWTGVMFSDIFPGAWNGTSYSNEWSGFHMNVPAGYEIVPASATGTIGTSKSFVEFVVRTPDGTGSAMELEYADAYDFTNGAATTPEYLVSMYSVMLALSGYTIESVTTVNLGGKTYIKLAADGAGMIKRDFYCRKAGDHYFECLSVMYWLASKPAVDTMLGGIY